MYGITFGEKAMRLLYVILLATVLCSGCALTNNGKMELDFVLDIDVVEELIKGGIGIGLPLALEKIDDAKIQKHAESVAMTASSILSVLEDKNVKLDNNEVNRLLEKMDKNLTLPEKHAIQTSIELVLNLIRKKVKPQDQIDADIRKLLIVFFREVLDAYRVYSGKQIMPLRSKCFIKK